MLVHGFFKATAILKHGEREKAIHQLALTLRRDVATLRRGQHPKSDWVKVLQSN